MLRDIAVEHLNMHAIRHPEEAFVREVLTDYWICCVSREASMLGRKEVLGGKAKFGIFGDGKEIPQVALAKAFRKGDWRSGYYRDQTWMFALGLSSVEAFFAQLYSDPANDPFSGGRQMNCHFATPLLGADGRWLSQTDRYNSSADISPTGGQMARAVGLAQASAWYRHFPELGEQFAMSQAGQEVCFVSIGDASTSEGVFWESINAAAVVKAPMAVSVWDDGYGISVPIALQTAKQSISRLLEGFHVDENGEGIYLYTAKGWDYPGLCEMYERGIQKVRKHHLPAVFHIQECTQPQGHSTSGSHERYKSPERLQWEKEYDCITRMASWIAEIGLASAQSLEDIREQAVRYTRECKDRAWNDFVRPLRARKQQLNGIVEALPESIRQAADIKAVGDEIRSPLDVVKTEVLHLGMRLRHLLLARYPQDTAALDTLLAEWRAEGEFAFNTHLHATGPGSALTVPVLRPLYSDTSEVLTGYQVLNRFFDHALARDPRIIAFGEDVGQIGDVNQGFAGLQEKYGRYRVFDTGIREWTIMGQAIGMALRGWRPIAEIQYLDYLLYGICPLSDDLATLRYRTNGRQAAPAIIRTRGHRLEGIWHSGSPMGMLLHSLRGLHICVPRNMVQAAGIYNTLLQADEPGLVIECLNGYRLRERCPDNLGHYTVPLGSPEILRSGDALTLVTYGSTVRIAEEALEILDTYGLSVELIDVQTLLPFDLEQVIGHSLRKTGSLLVVDEDVPGGASAYILQQVVDGQNGYFSLDRKPRCLTGQPHRPAYGSDGDYFSKPTAGDIVRVALEMMAE